MLRVRYEYSDDRTPDEPVAIEERRGSITFRLCRGLFLPEGVVALNSAVDALMAGGQWFQLWKGDIISMSTPLRERTSAWIHRGPMVDQTAGPSHW